MHAKSAHTALIFKAGDLQMQFAETRIAEYDALHSIFNFGFGDVTVRGRLIELWVKLAGSKEAEMAWQSGEIGAPWDARELN